MKKFNVILATDIKGGFGKNNDIPWDFSLDMDFFKNITKQKTILPGVNENDNILIMGKNTWDSLGRKVLIGRKNYVITSDYIKLNESNNSSKTYFFPDFHSAYMDACLSIDSEIWIIGGKRVYDTALRHWACNQIYWTHILSEFDTDVQIDMTQYKIKWTNQKMVSEINNVDGKLHNLVFKQGTLIPNVETKYLETLFDVSIYGESRQTRNAVTLSKFSKTISWDLADGFPLLTTKKMFWKGIVEELLFFIRGETDTTKLSELGVKIWEPNTNQQFLDKMKFDYPVGSMGPMYGYQWRHFNKPFPENDTNKHLNGIDQLKKVIEEIKSDPNSRRILMTDFNPEQAHLGVLYPCHSIVIQFYVETGRLSCSMYQRSGDLFLGVPFNIASTSLLLHIIAQLTGLKPGIVNLIIGDYHIYSDHLQAVNEQLERVPFNLPQLSMSNFDSLEQVEQSQLSDYQITNYSSHPAIKATMIA